MADRTLHEVLGEIFDAAHRYPELSAQIFHCLFDGGRVREGLYRIDVSHAPRFDGPNGSREQLAMLTTKCWPTDWLLQFAAAISSGFIPEGAFPMPERATGSA